ncbi:MAG: alpha/beta hydrolase [Nostocoides sp.]
MDIILVAGLWLDASVWDRTAAALSTLGHRPVPVALPGQGDGNTSATLGDQVAAVLAAVDAAYDPASEKPLVVGHSAACGLAWLAADARPDRVAGVVLVGGFPNADGERYAPSFPIVDGAMPFPGWEPFEGPDSADLDDAARQGLAAAFIPVPGPVSTALVHLADDRRYDVPMVMICPEYSPEQAKEWVAAGELPELTRIRDVRYVDIDSGHWPMTSRPDDLARLLAQAADAI